MYVAFSKIILPIIGKKWIPINPKPILILASYKFKPCGANAVFHK